MDPKACERSAKDASDFNVGRFSTQLINQLHAPLQRRRPSRYTSSPKWQEPSFQKSQVEVLAKRKFSYAHLAQMKYILSEGIHIDKVLVHDKKSLCMKPDMKITLVFEVVEEHSEQSADMALRQYFSSRLIDFNNMHPE
ncbi:Winged helix DNA-binding domain superfamily, partial [Sesbania bispinosa]